MKISLISFLLVICTIIPLLSFNSKANFKLLDKFIENRSSSNNSYIPVILLDSKKSRNTLVLLSSLYNYRDTFSNSIQGAFLHLTLIDVLHYPTIAYKGIIDLTLFIKLYNFFNAKIIDVDNLIFSISLTAEISSLGNQPYQIIAIFQLSQVNKQILYFSIASQYINWCNLFFCEGFLSLTRSKIFLVIQIVFNNPASGQTLHQEKTLIECNFPLSNGDLNCPNITLFNYKIQYPGKQLNDKTFLQNSLNQIFIGAAYDSSLLDNCQNLVLYSTNDPIVIVGSTLDYLIQCDPSSILVSYTRFILLMGDNKIINIGLECSEFDSICISTYITISIIDTQSKKYDLYNHKINLIMSSLWIADAILLIDESTLYLLGNIKTIPNSMITLFEISIKLIPLTYSLDPSNIRGLIFPLYCVNIHQIRLFIFALHCQTIEYIGATGLSFVIKEIFYFIQYFYSTFEEIGYFDYFEEKFHLSIYSPNENYLIVSSSQFFHIFDLLLLNDIHIVFPPSSENHALINVIIQNGNNIYYSGCYRPSFICNYTSIIYVQDRTSLMIQNSKEFQYPNINHCIVSQTVLANENIITAISSLISFQISKCTIIILDNNLNILNPTVSFESMNNNCPLELIDQNNFLVLQSVTNITNGLRYINIKSFDNNLQNQNEMQYLSNHDIAANTFLINSINDFTFGGNAIVKGKTAFWVAHYKKNSELKLDYLLGKDRSNVLASCYVAQRIQSFSGFINAKQNFFKESYNSFIHSIILLISDRGSFLFSSSIGEYGFIISSNKRLDDSFIITGITGDSEIQSYYMEVIMNCNFNGIFDTIENGCFTNCLNTSKEEECKICNPSKLGCTNEGLINPQYQCINDFLFNIHDSRYVDNFVPCSSKFVDPNKIIVNVNQNFKIYFKKAVLEINHNWQKKYQYTFNRINIFKELNYIEFDLYQPKDLYCQSKSFIRIKQMIIQSLNDSIICQAPIEVHNLDNYYCNNKNSFFSDFVLNKLNASSNYIIGFTLGLFAVSLNPAGIINIINSINELTTFQLINLGQTYPSNINQLMNITSLFSFNFLNDILDTFFDTSYLKNADWFDNNIKYHNMLQSTSFLYNFIPFILPIFSLFCLMLLTLFIYFQGRISMIFRTNANFHYFIILYEGIYYEITIISISSIFYDSDSFSIFTLISGLLAFIFLMFLLITKLFFISLLHYNLNELNNPEFEEFYSVIYPEVKGSEPLLYAELLKSIKIQFPIFICIFFQNHTVVQLAILMLLYLYSFILYIKYSPYNGYLDNIQYFLSEIIFLFLSISYFIYFIFLIQDSTIILFLRDILFILFLLIMGLQLFSSCINSIYKIINSMLEKSVFQLLKRRILFLSSNMKIERVQYLSRCKYSENFQSNFTRRFKKNMYYLNSKLKQNKNKNHFFSSKPITSFSYANLLSLVKLSKNEFEFAPYQRDLCKKVQILRNKPLELYSIKNNLNAKAEKKKENKNYKNQQKLYSNEENKLNLDYSNPKNESKIENYISAKSMLMDKTSNHNKASNLFDTNFIEPTSSNKITLERINCEHIIDENNSSKDMNHLHLDPIMFQKVDTSLLSQETFDKIVREVKKSFIPKYEEFKKFEHASELDEFNYDKFMIDMKNKNHYKLKDPSQIDHKIFSDNFIESNIPTNHPNFTESVASSNSADEQDKYAHLKRNINVIFTIESFKK